MALVDVLAYEQPDGATSYSAVAAGEGEAIVAAHEREVRKRRLLRRGVVAFVAVFVLGYALLIVQQLLIGLIAAGVVLAAYAIGNSGDDDAMVPSLVEAGIREAEAEDAYDLDARAR